MDADPDRILGLFLEEARSVWNNSELIGRISVSVVFDDTKSMALSTSGSPRAFGRSLYQVARNYTLHVGKVALKYSDDRFVRTLRHEAIHIGHMRHTEEFFRVAKEVNATITGAHEKGYGYQVQVQDVKGGRFRLVKKFDEEGDAVTFQQDLAVNYRRNGKRFSAIRVKF